MGNSSIDTTASLSNQLGGPIVLYASGGSTVVDSGPIASVIVVTMTAGTEGTGLTTPTTSLPPPITSPPSSSSRDTWTSLFQSTLAAGNTSPSISAFSSLTDSSGPSSSSSIPYATPSSSIDVSSTRLGEEIGLSIGIPLCLLLSGLLVRNIYWRRGHFFRRGSPSESSPKELKSSQPIYIQSSPVKAPTTQRQELSGWQAPELMDSTNKF
ncbi:hypothetical protein MMC10_001920 [Thelotrema lepadinum]|nr:hypothetical protein [Thelotrema lepadinum]